MLASVPGIPAPTLPRAIPLGPPRTVSASTLDKTSIADLGPFTGGPRPIEVPPTPMPMVPMADTSELPPLPPGPVIPKDRGASPTGKQVRPVPRFPVSPRRRWLMVGSLIALAAVAVVGGIFLLGLLFPPGDDPDPNKTDLAQNTGQKEPKDTGKKTGPEKKPSVTGPDKTGPEKTVPELPKKQPLPKIEVDPVHRVVYQFSKEKQYGLVKPGPNSFLDKWLTSTPYGLWPVQFHAGAN
jgi:hypothetical protein